MAARNGASQASRSRARSQPSIIGAPCCPEQRDNAITPTNVPRADSNGRRNTVFVGLWKPLIKRLCGRFPAERLSGSGVEGCGHGGDLRGAMHAEIGAFRKV